MTTTTQGESRAALRVNVAADCSQAELLIPGDFPRVMLNEQFCLAMLKQSGVHVNAQVEQSVRELLTRLPPVGGELRGVVARATPATDGEDGRIEWVQPAPAGESPGAKPAARSHYERCALIMVEAGQVVGRVLPPKDGADGQDVLGGTLRARPGKPAQFTHDHTLIRDASDQLIAQCQGVLLRGPEKLAVQPCIEVDKSVDLSTCNLNFPGSILIHQGVRDRVVVKAGGNVEVRGLIEAATVDCEGDLLARGGFAGRERGHARVKGSLYAKYLNNVEGQVGGHLQVDREVINCQLTIHGQVQSPHGAIIGGKAVVTGKTHVGTLGSDGSVPTQLVVGAVPKLEPSAATLAALVVKLREHHDALVAENKRIDQLTGAKSRMTSADKERRTEIMYELQSLCTALARGEAALTRVQQAIEQRRTVDVLVELELHQGVVITLRDQSFKISKEVRGPVHIQRQGGDMVFSRQDGATAPLARISEVRAAA